MRVGAALGGVVVPTAGGIVGSLTGTLLHGTRGAVEGELGRDEASHPWRERHAAVPRTLELRVGDARVEPFGAATSRVLFYATCFPRSLSEMLQRRLASELPAGARVLAAGARGWQPLLQAAHHEDGGPRWLVNAAAVGPRNKSDEATESEAPLGVGDERPCLGDVGAMVWTLEGRAGQPGHDESRP